jgi:hypothetical protein
MILSIIAGPLLQTEVVLLAGYANVQAAAIQSGQIGE